MMNETVFLHGLKSNGKNRVVLSFIRNGVEWLSQARVEKVQRATEWRQTIAQGASPGLCRTQQPSPEGATHRA
jgi:hypothetical protein